MLKCNQVSRIVSGEEMSRLGLMRRLELKMHLFMCVHCRRYAGQIRALGRGIRNLSRHHEPAPDQTERMRDTIITRICSHDT